jgi:hypothetical protein
MSVRRFGNAEKLRDEGAGRDEGMHGSMLKRLGSALNLDERIPYHPGRGIGQDNLMSA